MTGTIMRGAICPSSEDGGQAQAAGTSRHEVRDGEESQRMGARTTIYCHAPASVELSSQSPSSAVRTRHVGQASNLRARAAATAAGTSRQADGHAAAASTLARAWQMNATPTPWISSPNAPGGLERVAKPVAGIGSAATTAGTSRPAMSGWPQQRLASPPQGAGQNAGGQGPKAAPYGLESTPAGAVLASRGAAWLRAGCHCPR